MTKPSNPRVITGVVMPTPLRELSVLLGIEVIDVRRGLRVVHENARGDQQPKIWVLVRPPGTWFNRATSAEFRHADRLNELLSVWGRPLWMEPLTSADGRRALRLMHEHMEQIEAVETEGSR